MHAKLGINTYPFKGFYTALTFGFSQVEKS